MIYRAAFRLNSFELALCPLDCLTLEAAEAAARATAAACGVPLDGLFEFATDERRRLSGFRGLAGAVLPAGHLLYLYDGPTALVQALRGPLAHHAAHA